MKRTITKSLGDGNTIEIPDPDYFDENGFHVKRRKPTNITPKKKKRK